LLLLLALGRIGREGGALHVRALGLSVVIGAAVAATAAVRVVT